MLPCDPKIATAVDEVSRTSEARLAAFDQYFRAVLAQTSSRASQANRILDLQKKSENGFLETERAEGVEERAGTEIQISQLAANAVRKPELGDSESALRAVAALTDQRNQVMVQQTARGEALLESLRALALRSQAAETAMKALVAAHANEADRWRAYYTARLGRVQAECSAIGGSAPRPRADSRLEPFKKGESAK